MTRRHVLCLVAAIAGGLATVTLAGQAPQRGATSQHAPAPPTVLRPTVLRPPAVPLVAHDPYFSIWSPADRLTDALRCTGPAEFWLNAQRALDLWKATRSAKRNIERIKPLNVA